MIKDLKCTFKYFNVTSLQSALFKRLYIMYYQQAQFKKKKKAEDKYKCNMHLSALFRVG